MQCLAGALLLQLSLLDLKYGYGDNEKNLLIRSTKLLHTLFKRRFGRVSSVLLQALMLEKLSYKCYNERITTRDNVAV